LLSTIFVVYLFVESYDFEGFRVAFILDQRGIVKI
jgi:hypothetical protein